MSEKLDLTLDDVEIAIKVLNEFMRRQRQALATMTRLGATTGKRGGMGFNIEDIYSMVVKDAMARRGVTPEQPSEGETELSEDELKRMREIKDKIKKEGSSPSTHRGY